MADGSPHPIYGQPPRPRFPWLMVSMLTLISVAAIAFLVAAAWWQATLATELNFRQMDRNLMVTASDAEPYIDGFLVRIDAERASRKRLPDDTLVIQYDYNHPEAGNSLVIHCKFILKENAEDAAAEYTRVARRTRAAAANVASGAKFVAQSNLFSHGDSSQFGSIVIGDEARGGLLTCRVKDRVFTALVYGDQLNADGFLTMVEPALAAVDEYLREETDIPDLLPE